MLAAKLNRLAERIANTLVDASTSVHRHISDTSGDIRRFAANTRAVDARILLEFNRLERANPPRFSGREIGTRRIHEFTPRQILSTPIRDPNGNTVGVALPSKRSDSKLPLRFTPESYKSIHREYYQYVQKAGTKAGDPPIWFRGRTFRAPWAKKAKGDPDPELVFDRTHASGTGYDIRIKVKPPGKIRSRWITVSVDGATHGRILASNKHFKDAAKNKPTAKLIRMECASADGSASPLSAESLHSAGIGFDSWATRESHLTDFGPDGRTILSHGSGMKVDKHGKPTEWPWGVNRAPSRPPETPD